MQGTTNVTEQPVRHRSPRAASDYSRLLLSVQAAGLFRRRYLYYTVKIAVLVVALAATGVAFAVIGDSWAQMGVAAGLAVVLTQIVFLSHDAAHRQIFGSHKANEIAALLMGTLVGGVSLAWWNNKHNKHHASTFGVMRQPVRA